MRETPENDINIKAKEYCSPCDNMHVWRDGRIINDSDNHKHHDFPPPRGPKCSADTNREVLFLAAPSIPKDGWLGLGTAGDNFTQHSILIPAGTRIKGLTLNTRDDVGTPITGTIWISPCGLETTSTGIAVTVESANPPNCCNSVKCDYKVSECSLISVNITSENELLNGASAFIYLDMKCAK